jgi:hypothetical protein
VKIQIIIFSSFAGCSCPSCSPSLFLEPDGGGPQEVPAPTAGSAPEQDGGGPVPGAGRRRARHRSRTAGGGAGRRGPGPGAGALSLPPSLPPSLPSLPPSLPFLPPSLPPRQSRTAGVGARCRLVPGAGRLGARCPAQDGGGPGAGAGRRRARHRNRTAGALGLAPDGGAYRDLLVRWAALDGWVPALQPFLQQFTHSFVYSIPLRCRTAARKGTGGAGRGQR